MLKAQPVNQLVSDHWTINVQRQAANPFKWSAAIYFLSYAKFRPSQDASLHIYYFLANITGNLKKEK